MSKAAEKAYTVLLQSAEIEVKADRFLIEEGVLRFLTGTDVVAAFNRWEGVI